MQIPLLDFWLHVGNNTKFVISLPSQLIVCLQVGAHALQTSLADKGLYMQSSTVHQALTEKPSWCIAKIYLNSLQLSLILIYFITVMILSRFLTSGLLAEFFLPVNKILLCRNKNLSGVQENLTNESHYFIALDQTVFCDLATICSQLIVAQQVLHTVASYLTLRLQAFMYIMI